MLTKLISKLLGIDAVNPTFPLAVLDVHDGDTVKGAVRLLKLPRLKDRSLGFHLYVEGGWLTLHTLIRLDGMNCAELVTDAGKAARAYLLSLLAVGDVVTLQSRLPSQPIATDKYGGRWDGVLVKNGVNLNEKMVVDGYAAPWSGQGTKPVPAWPIPAKA